MSNSIQHDKKCRILVKKHELNRKLYKHLINNLTLSTAVRLSAQQKLNDLPKKSSKIRISNRCVLTGRSKSTYRQFKISRIKLREYALMGKLHGVQKSSW